MSRFVDRSVFIEEVHFMTNIYIYSIASFRWQSECFDRNDSLIRFVLLVIYLSRVDVIESCTVLFGRLRCCRVEIFKDSNTFERIKISRNCF